MHRAREMHASGSQLCVSARDRHHGRPIYIYIYIYIVVFFCVVFSTAMHKDTADGSCFPDSSLPALAKIYSFGRKDSETSYAFADGFTTSAASPAKGLTQKGPRPRGFRSQAAHTSVWKYFAGEAAQAAEAPKT